MTKISAERLIAHGEACDGIGCEVIIQIRNEVSKAPGFYIQIERVSSLRKDPTKTDESGVLFFHDKDCMLYSLQWGLSSYYNGTWRAGR